MNYGTVNASPINNNNTTIIDAYNSRGVWQNLAESSQSSSGLSGLLGVESSSHNESRMNTNDEYGDNGIYNDSNSTSSRSPLSEAPLSHNTEGEINDIPSPKRPLNPKDEGGSTKKPNLEPKPEPELESESDSSSSSESEEDLASESEEDSDSKSKLLTAEPQPQPKPEPLESELLSSSNASATHTSSLSEEPGPSQEEARTENNISIQADQSESSLNSYNNT